MADPAVPIYQELAAGFERTGDAPMRDRFLVLAAAGLSAEGRAAEAERLRTHLLQLNPHHMLKPYETTAKALQAPDVRNYVEGLRRHYPAAEAAKLLETLRQDELRLQPATTPSGPVYNLREEAARVAAGRPGVVQLPGSKASPYKVLPPSDRPGLEESLFYRDPQDLPPASWFCTLLAAITLVAGVAYGGWAIARPFLPW